MGKSIGAVFPRGCLWWAFRVTGGGRAASSKRVLAGIHHRYKGLVHPFGMSCNRGALFVLPTSPRSGLVQRQAQTRSACARCLRHLVSHFFALESHECSLGSVAYLEPRLLELHLHSFRSIQRMENALVVSYDSQNGWNGLQRIDEVK